MFRALIIAVTISATPVLAQDAEQHMTLERMGQIIKVLDEDANTTPSGFEFIISDVSVLIVADSRANHMRAMVPISSLESMTSAELECLMQANFDGALDTRLRWVGFGVCSSVPRQHVLLAVDVVRTDVGPRHGTCSAQKSSSDDAQDQCKPLSSFFQNDCWAVGRRGGLRRFPMRPPLGSACPVTDQKLHAGRAHSLSEDASVP